MTKRFQASAPGSLMLMGEHAVLRGRHALVAAVDQRLTVLLEPRPDRRLVLHSELGDYEADLDALHIEAPFQFVLTAVATWAPSLPGGLELNVTSPFASDLGLGSSAAVTLATHTCLSAYAGRPHQPRALFDAGLATIHSVQGLGSGADLAASTWGGFVLYRADPRKIRRLSHTYPLAVVYSGYKTPTPEVVRRVNAACEANPDIYEQYFNRIDELVLAAAVGIEAEDWPKVGEQLNLQQEVMTAMQLNTPELDEIVTALRASGDILGAKISGSGLGDCAVGLGEANYLETDFRRLEATAGVEGVRLETL